MTDERLYPRILLRRGEETRLLAGHQWVFSNEIEAIEPVRPKGPMPEVGDLVEVRRKDGWLIGLAMYHPNSLIAARLLTRAAESGADVTIDEAFFADRLRRARQYRETLFPGASTYRLSHGESDDLPGLVIDRFDTGLSVQTFSAGMDRRLAEIVAALHTVIPEATVIVERNTSPLRKLEGLEAREGVLFGELPDGPIRVSDDLVRYDVDLTGGQKTGLFLDQRENRKTIRPFCNGARVLDLFTNEGGFALHAAQAGASSVLGLDISEGAVERARANAALNGLTGVEFRQADVFQTLPQMVSAGEQFDVVVLDPPSFTRSRKEVPDAKRGYRTLHQAAMKLIRPGGVLATASCSHHIAEDVFAEIVQTAAQSNGRRLRLIARRSQAPDHPVLLAMPETKYLKYLLVQVQ